jgi:hypothetical protein
MKKPIPLEKEWARRLSELGLKDSNQAVPAYRRWGLFDELFIQADYLYVNSACSNFPPFSSLPQSSYQPKPRLSEALR